MRDLLPWKKLTQKPELRISETEFKPLKPKSMEHSQVFHSSKSKLNNLLLSLKMKTNLRMIEALQRHN